jgi:hypothetical protein
MRLRACQLCLIVSAATAAPAALAGHDIMKCIDSTGHVTLTDQPCEAGSTAVRLSIQPSLPPAVTAVQLHAVPAVRYVPPPPRLQNGKWRPPQARERAPLARDVATLKAARAQQLLLDEGKGHQPKLAVN